MQATDWAWLAGFFDGEGSIALRYRYRVRRSKGEWIARVTISQSRRETLEHVASLVGGGRIQKYARVFEWRCETRELVQYFVAGVLQYSVRKREELLKLQAWLDLPTQSPGRRMSDAQVALRREIQADLAALKRPPVLAKQEGPEA